MPIDMAGNWIVCKKTKMKFSYSKGQTHILEFKYLKERGRERIMIF